MQIEAAHVVEITKLVEYVDRKEDPRIQVVRTHQHNTDSAVLQTARCLKTELQRGTRQLKDGAAQETKERRRGKRIQGLFPCKRDEKLVDNEWSYCWLQFEDIKGETESMRVADQGQTASKTIVKIKF